MQLKELLKDLNYSCVQGSTEVEITDIIYDSRKVVPGCAFVCLIGSSVDSHQYAQQAVNDGAAAIIACNEISISSGTLIMVEDTRYTMACMAAAFFGHPANKLKTIGLTGTKGKTTTSCMIQSILEKGGIKTGLIGTLGIVIGGSVTPTNNTTPESYDIQKYLHKMVQEGCQCAVIEASSLGLKWHRTAGFTYDYGVFTNFSPDHIGANEHASLEEYLQCKSMLFKMCKLGIVNRDDSYWEEIIKGHTCGIETYGFSPEADVIASGEKLISRPGYIGAHFDVSGAVSMSVDVDIPGMFSTYNALAALSVCRHFDIGKEQIFAGLNEVKVKGRVEVVPVSGSYTLLIDYAHNAVSMQNILQTLREYHPNRLVCMFGAGGNRAKSRRYEMGEICGNMADLSVITADNSRFEDVMDIIEDIKIGMAKTSGEYVVIPDRKQAIRYCMEHAQTGDVVVLAGKGHEDYQEIKGVKYHFDEREVIADILKDLEKDR